MKKISGLLVTLLVCVNIFAQQTSLVVDNQMPGWLSSKINYVDQKTIKDLTVSGYLNETDLAFIGELISKQSLEDKIDLTNANIVGTGTNKDNYASENMFALTRQDSVRTIVLPLSLESATNCLKYLVTDTLIAGSEKMHVITKGCFSHSDYVNLNCVADHVILREGVDSIAEYSFGFWQQVSGFRQGPYTKLKSIKFPSSLIFIGRQAFANCTSLENIVLPPNIKEIHKDAFFGAKGNWEKLVFPESIEICDLSAFTYKSNHFIYPNAEIFFPENIKEIRSVTSVYFENGGAQDALSVYENYKIHFKSKTPPKWNYATFNCLVRSTIYVPKGCKAAYKAKSPYDKATIIEVIPVENLQINVEDVCYVGESKTINLVVSPTNATYSNVVWKVSDEDIAEITETDGNNCTLTFKSVGEVKISAIIDNDEYSVERIVNVCDHTSGIQISEAQKSIYLNDTFTLSANTLPLDTSDGKVTWSSNDTDIATVDENGNVKGKQQGKCTITATSVDGGHTATCEVTVMQPVAEVWLDKHELIMNVGDNSTLRVNVSPSSADDKTISWSTEDETVAAVDAEGMVTAVASGTTKIWATSNDNNEVKDYCEVTVNQPVTGISLDYSEYILDDIASSFTLTADVQPETATNKEVTWLSSDENVCIVSNGLVVATGYGKTVIMATTKDGGYLAICTVEVVNATGINEKSCDGGCHIYNENGIEVSSMRKGINIIRLNNGTIRKVVVK